MAATELQINSLVKMMIQLYRRMEDPKLAKQYELQRSRYENMSTGGDGGKAGLYGRRISDPKRSTHEASIRELHHTGWADSDFLEFLNRLDRAIQDYHDDSGEAKSTESPGVENTAPDVEFVADAVFDLLSTLPHNDIVYVLNDMAEQLGVLEPDND